MHIQELRKNIIKKTVIYFVLLLLVGGGWFFLSKQKQTISEKNAFIQNEKNSIERQLDDLEKKALGFQDDILIWEKIDEDSRKIAGLQFAKAEEVLSGLQKKYFLTNFKPTFSKPAPLEGNLKNETCYAEFSDISLSFDSPSDANTLAFINELGEVFPGYIIVNKATISLNKEVTPDFLYKMAIEGSGNLVSAQLNLTWLGIQSVAKASNVPAEQVQGQPQSQPQQPPR